MYIQCTKKMLDKLDSEKIRMVSADECDDGADGFYSWHVNYITINRRKVIVCMNNLTRYTIIIYRPKAKDIAHFESRIKEGIRTAFLEEGIPREMVEEYFRNCGDVKFSKTKDRRLLANLNQTCQIVQYYAELLDEDAVVQSRASLNLGRYMVKFEGQYECPAHKLFRAFCRMRNIPEQDWEQILEIENYQLKIRLMLEHYDIWRRILIPARCTFEELHMAIQYTFGWFGYHLHEFSVVDQNYKAEEGTPLYAYPKKIRIVDGEDPEVEQFLERDRYEVKYDTKTSLRGIFQETDRCIYTYDFGDNWEHEIILEKVERNSHNRIPYLLEQKGERPPEDVGGEGGFEEYMRIVSDPENPEYEFMVQWSENTRADQRTIEEINRQLNRYYGYIGFR